jgi:outer membrane lipoprotein-sorting protein
LRAAALFLLASLAGCASNPKPAAAPRPPRSPVANLEQVLGAYQEYCDGIQSFSASGDLEVRDLHEGKARKLGVRVVATRGGRLYLKGSVAIVTALEVVSDGQRFWFQVPSKKTVWTGDASSTTDTEAGADDAPYYALRPRDVTRALVPERLDPAANESLVLEADGQAYSLTLATLDSGRGTARCRVWLTRNTLLPLRGRLFDAHGEVVTDWNYADWDGGLPRTIRVFRPIEGYLAIFTLTKAQRNVTVPEKAFSPRTAEGYKVVEVSAK